jgi:CheY-like chemotaxis protein
MRTLTFLMTVENDPESLYILDRYYKRGRYRPIWATPENALALARQTKPDVILLDVTLPGLSGWQVLQALKADPVMRSIPVIICSEQDEADRARKAEAATFLKKPFSPQDFLDALGDAGIE